MSLKKCPRCQKGMTMVIDATQMMMRQYCCLPQ